PSDKGKTFDDDGITTYYADIRRQGDLLTPHEEIALGSQYAEGRTAVLLLRSLYPNDYSFKTKKFNDVGTREVREADALALLSQLDLSDSIDFSLGKLENSPKMVVTGFVRTKRNAEIASWQRAELFAKITQADVARQTLTLKNLKLVIKTALKYRGRGMS